MTPGPPRIVWLEATGPGHVPLVGPKMATLAAVRSVLSGAAAEGRPAAEGVTVPRGFTITTAAFEEVMAQGSIGARVEDLMRRVELGELAAHDAGRSARELILAAPLPDVLRDEIRDAVDSLEARALEDQAHENRVHGASAGDGAGAGTTVLLAVRSSGTTEDLPNASFAGQHDSYLGVHGLGQLLDAYRGVLASLYSDRAISYRQELGLDLRGAAMAVGVQVLVRADLDGAAGVAMTADPDAGPGSPVGTAPVLVEAGPGLGDSLVGGGSDPERYLVRGAAVERQSGPEAPSVTTDEVRRIARCGTELVRSLGHHLDIEWAIDGRTRQLVVVQARPLTAGRRTSAEVPAEAPPRPSTEVLTRGVAIGTGSVKGPVHRQDDPLEGPEFVDGSILVATTTDPSWLPLMRRAAAIVTDHGGRTSHAAIVSRELGLLAVVGCGDATRCLSHGSIAVVVCGGAGVGLVYRDDESS